MRHSTQHRDDTEDFRTSARGGNRNRDEQGRFSNEDDYYGSRASHSGSGSRSTRSQGRGWFGDEEGHREAAEMGWENGHRGQRSSSRSSYADDDYDDYRSSRSGNRNSGNGSQMRDRDDQGRFMSDDDRFGGSRERGQGRYTDDDDYRSYSRSRQTSGRNTGRYAQEDDYDDHRGMSSRGSRSSHGGWFGDEEGHREAAERGWENGHRGQRRRSSGSY